jgi:hypothetical protein
MKRIVLRMIADVRANPFAHGVILLLPAIQFGLSYFASVAAVLFVLTAVHMRARITPFTTGVVMIAVSLSLLWTVIFLPDLPNMPREMRLAAGILLLLWGLDGAPRHDFSKLNGMWPLAVLLLLALAALAQAVAGRKGIALYVPTKLFINSNDVSLGAAWAEHAREHGYDFKIRPSASFSEPSYLGGVSLFLNFVCLHTLRGRPRLVANAVALLTCLIAQTFFGLLANAVILFAFYHRHINKSVMLCLAAFGLATLALPIFAAEPSRIERILSGNDVSVGLRLFQPFDVFAHVLANTPFGIPMTVAPEYFIDVGMVQRFEDAPFQNGAFNVLFAFGWLGLPVLWLLLRKAGGGICALFLLLLMCQNGAPFDFDKIVMAIFAIHLARTVRANTDLYTLTQLTVPRRVRPWFA